MKKLIQCLLFGFFLCGFNISKIASQINPYDTPTNCNQCNSNDPRVHDIDSGAAFKLIKKFQKNFDVTSYGGTIYGTIDYFMNIPDISKQDKSPVIKYHFCTDGINSKNLFIVFEKEPCIESTQKKEFYVYSNKEIGECRKSNEQIFKDALSFLRLSTSSFPSRIDKNANLYNYFINSPTGQIINAEDVNQSIDNLSRNKYLKEHLHCPLRGGNYNFNSSIGVIFKDTTCRGIRYYFGFEEGSSSSGKAKASGNEIKVILVGVDAEGNNLDVWKENSLEF